MDFKKAISVNGNAVTDSNGAIVQARLPTDLTDGGDSTLHYHAADRARANHTGTQLASTISDFQEAVDDRMTGLLVPGNGMVLTYNDALNTLTIDALIDLATDVTGVLGAGLGGTGVAALPTFLVRKNGTNQTLAQNTWTKVTWPTEAFDTNSNFASDRFTPSIAGKYFFSCVLLWNNTLTAGNRGVVQYYKNGSPTGLPGNSVVVNSTGGQSYYAVLCPALISMNGTTDYVEIYALHTVTGSHDIYGGAESTFWMGLWGGP